MELIDRFNLIKQNTVEILTDDELKKLLQSKKNPSAYWGIAPTGPVHMGYLATLGKIFDLNKAGVNTKIMIADIHAALDDLKTPWEDIQKRREYVKKCIELAIPLSIPSRKILGLVTYKSSPTNWILSLNFSVISAQPSQSASSIPSSIESMGYLSSNPAR